MSAAPAIVVLGPGGVATATRLKRALPGVRVHGLGRRVDDADVRFDDTGAHLRQLFTDGVPIIGVCASGILIRCLAPALTDKTDEPAVVAVAEDGGAVVPLLGGHYGGNDLARAVGEILGVAPAITTAGDIRFGVALDAPPPGWHLVNPDDHKPFVAALLAGESVRLIGDATWLTEGTLPITTDAALTFRVTEAAQAGSARELVYHPSTLAVGVGCERGTDPDELLSLVREALSEAGLAERSVGGIFSLDLKADEPAVHHAAAAFDVPAQFFDAATLEAETPRLANPSDIVFRAVGCHGVAEGAALAAAGGDGTLVVPKTKSRRATCAIAHAPAVIDAMSIGRGRGWLGIVGIGPGAADWRTPEADAFLARATDIVGYGLYLDLIAEEIAGKTQHRFSLGAEEDRVRAALDLAAAGRAVALVSSGDPGIYAMASLVFELLDRDGGSARHRVEIAVAPGITALQAAAARIGAPMGHDFCAVSLSDLMTPWDTIENRVRAAGQGDFVIALYNPVSRRRAWQLPLVREILLETRDRSTPVVVARNLGRDGETVRVVMLGDLDPAEIDMLTVLLIGASTTRAVARGDGGAWVYTPRGYGDAARSKAAS